MFMYNLRIISKLDTLFYTVSFVSFLPDHNAQLHNSHIYVASADLASPFEVLRTSLDFNC